MEKINEMKGDYKDEMKSKRRKVKTRRRKRKKAINLERISRNNINNNNNNKSSVLHRPEQNRVTWKTPNAV